MKLRFNHIPLFHYNTIYTALLRDTKSLLVQLNRPKQGNAINREMIFELESLVQWISEHTEVHSVIITGQGDIFSQGLDWDEFEDLNEDKFLRDVKRLQKIICRLFQLPQTIIVDYKKGAMGAGLELGLGADIRVGHLEAKLQLSSLQQGLVSVCGGLGLLEHWVGKAHARNWQLTTGPIDTTVLLKSGFLYSHYEENNDFCFGLRSDIHKQSPVARIQTKLALNQGPAMGEQEDISALLEQNLEIASAAHWTKDWRLAREQETPNFMAAREVHTVLKQWSEETRI